MINSIGLNVATNSVASAKSGKYLPLTKCPQDICNIILLRNRPPPDGVTTSGINLCTGFVLQHATTAQVFPHCTAQELRSLERRKVSRIMARIFITGSSDGIGSLTAKRLVAQGHQVVLHARNARRAADAEAACPGSHACLVGDLSKPEETRRLAAEADRHGPYDCVIHNAALGPGQTPGSSRFAVNTLAPYVLTCLMDKPKRAIYVSSEMHRSGSPRLESLEGSGYSDTKLHNIMLAKAFARRWPDVQSNAADPGWVPTKMGGHGAPGDIQASVACFSMLALGEGGAEGATGKYFRPDLKATSCAKVADDEALQDGLLKKLTEKSGVEPPE